jgi:predicted transcriptional regulator
MERQRELTTQLNVRVEPELRERLDRLAQREDRDISYLVRRALWTVAEEKPDGRRG